MTNTNLSEDLAYVRDLAEAGQSAPLLGGRFLVWWGVLVPVAYIAHYLISVGTIPGGGPTLGYMWGAFVVIGLSGQFFMAWKFPSHKPGASSAGNRASEYVWMAGGFAIFAFFVGIVAKSVMTGQPSEGFIWSVPIILALYSVGQLVSGLMSNTFALKLAGFAGLGGVAATAYFTDSNLIWLIGAGVVVAAVLVPGLLLLKAEPSETV